jgi:translation elongation factor EF-4
MVFAGSSRPTRTSTRAARRARAAEAERRALFYEPETSQALGFGFRCGFLGLLHMEIVRERLEREFDLDLIVTAPNVAYRVRPTERRLGRGAQPGRHAGEIEEVEEPYISASVIVPKEYVGAVMELCNERRGSFDHMEYLSEDRVHLTYELPLGEIVLDFYDQLKSRTRGYASFDYDMAGFKPGQSRACRRARRRRAGRCPLADHPPRVRLRPRQAARRAPAEGDPASVLRRADPGRDRRADHRP